MSTLIARNALTKVVVVVVGVRQVNCRANGVLGKTSAVRAAHGRVSERVHLTRIDVRLASIARESERAQALVAVGVIETHAAV